MGKLSILSEFFGYLWKKKKWWLIPIIIFLILLGVVIVLNETAVVAPFIYTLF